MLPRLLPLLAALLLLQACATPSERFLQTAHEFNFSNRLLNGAPFQHRLFLNARAENSAEIAELHVYLDGDGTPWRTDTRIADDPTARNPLILEMMSQDPAAAVLLGRPCYYGLSQAALCRDELWTSRRYSREQIDSMAAALRPWLADKRVGRLVLIGYSGGGVLAAFLAAELQQTAVLLTVAANLDVEAWSRHHGYPPPDGSLNPAREAHIPETVRQIHLAGLRDENVPAEIIAAFSRSQKNSLYIPLADHDHACCWSRQWTALLSGGLGE